MTKPKRIAALILKLLQQELTPLEYEQLDRWRDESPGNNATFFELLNVNKLKEEVAFYQGIDVDKAWDKFAAKNGLADPPLQKEKKPLPPARNTVGSARTRLQFEACPACP